MGSPSGAVAWLAAGLATVATAPAGAHGPGPDRREPGVEAVRARHREADALRSESRRRRAPSRTRRDSSIRSKGADDAHLHRRAPGAHDRARLRPRGRRPAVLRRRSDRSRRPVGHVGARCARPTARTLQFLWSYGNSTFRARRRPPVDTNLKISAVGTRPGSTTLFAPAAAGDANVKVAATTGRGRRIARTGRPDGRNVGTQADAAQCRAAAAGATNIKVASVTGLTAGDQLHHAPVEPRRDVDTAGANGPESRYDRAERPRRRGVRTRGPASRSRPRSPRPTPRARRCSAPARASRSPRR